jgi:hypothetical protein
MKWMRVVLGGAVAGVVVSLVDFVLHGQIMRATYVKFPQVFTQTQASPLYFIAISLVVGVMIATLFGRTRGSWAPGWRGGAAFGFYFGLAIFFLNFFYPLVIDGFPYYLAWCWGGINIVEGVVGGSVMGALIPRT